MALSRLAWMNLAAKLALAALILFYLTRPDLPQFEGKAMPLRSVFFPLAALLLPALWLARGRPSPYPHLPDALVVAAALFDYGGNAADMYRFEWFDHTVHFTNMVLLSTAFGFLLAARSLGRWVLAGLALGFGAVLHTLWEITEFLLVRLLGADLDIEYLTTILDFAAGLAGSTLGALLVATVAWRRRELGGRVFASDVSGPLPPAHVPA